ncbi:nitrilase-related carbon-nitrogen hydrolase [Dyella lutea]|uniref:CN hydrolase domain-containing protein n=1 Tax=Dyella lutea TaxID=2950441 RepID=A0ABT1FEM4_9GAMM|nr:nitrilase-related carbon-nitrogen hydrolase [Dyella lutea]MCP1375822.1 hypothetical protein [Dyella lutea]
MASKPDVREAATIIAATATSALLWWFGSGLHPLWWLTWLAPLPLLWLAPRTRRWRAALAALVAVAAGGLNQWRYLHDYIGLPLSVIVYVILLPAVLFALVVLLHRRLLLRGRALAATLAVPVTWTTIGYLNSLLSPHGTFGAIGYTQMNALPVIQVAALAGVWGIGFLVLLLPATLAVLASDAPRRGRLQAGTLCVAILLPALGYGAYRLQAPAEESLRIGLASLETPIRPPLASPQGQDLLARYQAVIARLAGQGARAVVIPETSFATADADIPAFAQQARQDRLQLDVGVEYQGEAGGERNMAMVFQPDNASPATYSKHHLIPGFEARYRPGSTYRMLDGSPRIGLAICKDMDFHDIGQAYAALGAQLLLVPAWDFSVDGWLHGRMAILRGVEGGFAVARAARSGRLTLSDDRGRVVAEASSEHHDAELVGDLPLRHTRTPYSRWGDLFAWLNLAGLLALLWRALRPARGA